MKPTILTICVMAFLGGTARQAPAQSPKPEWVRMEFPTKTILIKPGPGEGITMARRYRGEKGWRIHGPSERGNPTITRTWKHPNGVACHRLRAFSGDQLTYSEVVYQGSTRATRKIKIDDLVTGRREVSEKYRTLPDGRVQLTETTIFPSGSQRTSSQIVDGLPQAIDPNTFVTKLLTRE